MKLFNRHILKLHRDKAAKTISKNDHIIKDTTSEIIERVKFYSSKFDDVLDLSARTGYFSSNHRVSGLEIKNLYCADVSTAMLAQNHGLNIAIDDEFLPFHAPHFDLVINNLNLHWANDLVGSLIQARSILKENGVFIGTIFGGHTLTELKEALFQTETTFNKNVGYHVPPIITCEHMVSLMRRAKFKHAVVDSYTLKHVFPDTLKLMHFIKDMGESNCMDNKISILNREVIDNIDAKYKELFHGNKAEIEATFEIIVFVGRA